MGPVGPPGRDGPQAQVVFARRAKPQGAPAGQAVRVMVWLGLESWSTRPTGQAVRVMVWLGLESWSDTYTLFPRSHHTLSILIYNSATQVLIKVTKVTKVTKMIKMTKLQNSKLQT